jgi:predicted DsbA family dithiol-disulfide isomerase
MSETVTPTRITVDVVSDVVCPWCYVGQKRLEKAIAWQSGVEVDLRWRPYQLDPTIPPEGLDRKAYMLKKFGSEAKLREIHDRIVPVGRAEGIDFQFAEIEKSPNTLDAHRLIRWAASRGEVIQHSLVRALFSAFFEQGQDISDHETLIRIAAENGMDQAVVRSLLASDADVAEVRAEIDAGAADGRHRRALFPAGRPLCRCRRAGR